MNIPESDLYCFRDPHSPSGWSIIRFQFQNQRVFAEIAPLETETIELFFTSVTTPNTWTVFNVDGERIDWHLSSEGYLIQTRLYMQTLLGELITRARARKFHPNMQAWDTWKSTLNIIPDATPPAENIRTLLGSLRDKLLSHKETDEDEHYHIGIKSNKS